MRNKKTTFSLFFKSFISLSMLTASVSVFSATVDRELALSLAKTLPTPDQMNTVISLETRIVSELIATLSPRDRQTLVALNKHRSSQLQLSYGLPSSQEYMQVRTVKPDTEGALD